MSPGFVEIAKSLKTAFYTHNFLYRQKKETSFLRFFCADDMMLLAWKNTRFSASRHATKKEGCSLLTYSLTSENPRPLYEQLSELLRQDILAGRLTAGSRLPSKRSLSENLGVSTITVESAYNLLIDEGYVTSEPKRGYYVAELAFQQAPLEIGSSAAAAFEIRPDDTVKISSKSAASAADSETELLDLSGNRAPEDRFPFTVWARLLRNTINDLGPELLLPSPCGGVRPLREAIAAHLQSFRGMRVDPDCIIVGAGTEYLYGLLIQILGRDRIYCLENPGYRKAAQIYSSNGAECRWAPLDDEGMTVAGLEAAEADVAHISPTHHFPTGITMPVGRRYELLAWAAAKEGRFIIEDDYDSEFRLTGRPIPSLESIDRNDRVIYMNTFSKTLASTVRISYMVLPPQLAKRYYEQLSFYSCTVSNFEQYTLASFIGDGYFEKHLNRMRLFYARLRRQLLQQIASCPAADRIRVLERDSGLHFLLQFQTERSDEDLQDRLLQEGIRLNPLSVYYLRPEDAPDHTYLLSYSALSPAALDYALTVLSGVL